MVLKNLARKNDSYFIKIFMYDGGGQGALACSISWSGTLCLSHDTCDSCSGFMLREEYSKTLLVTYLVEVSAI